MARQSKLSFMTSTRGRFSRRSGASLCGAIRPTRRTEVLNFSFMMMRKHLAFRYFCYFIIASRAIYSLPKMTNKKLRKKNPPFRVFFYRFWLWHLKRKYILFACSLFGLMKSRAKIKRRKPDFGGKFSLFAYSFLFISLGRLYCFCSLSQHVASG